MPRLNSDFLVKCIETLEKSYKLLGQSAKDSIDYEMYRNSLVKSFELTLEQSGKLLRKKLTPYLASKKQADALVFKDIFRQAGLRGLLDAAAVERWCRYRDNRNDTAHDYGEEFAEETLALIEDFLRDARVLQTVIDNA
ncbi:MAG: nucleotidyltransferase substrate binding protein [Candidatus Margulisbacteria bacterium]|jgi:nucleotidyltransferase substrate binding protein (TIGR01987 family)|nr:nucleotidyltransferase substrate binding protein [Candidatus Margulisiibacteriota bacterium]